MKILFLGGNRYFGKKILDLLSKNKNNQIYLINRGRKKNFKKKNIFHFRIDRNNIHQISFFLKNNYFDIIFDNIAYKVSDVKKLLKQINNNFDTYFFTSTIIAKFINKKSYNLLKRNYSRSEITYGMNKFKIENFLRGKKLNNLRILRPYSVFGANDFSNKTKEILGTSVIDIKRYQIMQKDKIQFIYENDLVKIIYYLIKNYKKKPFKILEIGNDPIIFKEFNKMCSLEKKIINRKKYPFPLNLTSSNNKLKNIISFKLSEVNSIVKNVNKKLLKLKYNKLN